jgi:soluble lytic murein transglycosylase
VLAGQDEATWEDAARDFARLASEFPESDYAAQAGFRAGLIHYRLGNYDAARSRWQEAATAGRSAWNAAADFWLGKLLEAEGRTQEAWDHWRGVYERWGVNSYYGVRSRQKLAEAGQPLPPLDTPPEVDDAAVQAWVAGLSPDAKVADFHETPSEFAVAAEWHRLGERNRAHQALSNLRRQWKDAPVRLYQLALFAQELGYYDVSIRAALRLVGLSGQSILDAPRPIQELVYPTYYQELVLRFAQHFELDPALYFALIRQESLFWSPAASSAGARGLTQVMPGTGRSAAQQLGLGDFTVDDLSRPVVSLYIGAYILNRELQRNDGSVPRALASYNAGPGNASFWWELADGDEDLFVELISFRETQYYVRTVTVQAEHYRRLYPQLGAQTP